MDIISHLTEDTFNEAVDQPGFTVIDFWAGWCGPCGIPSIPTLVLPRDGEPLAAQAGVIGAEQLVDAVDRLAGSPAKAAA